MRGCEIVWGLETADRVQRLIRSAFEGETCPCDRDGVCPILGPVALPVPRPDVVELPAEPAVSVDVVNIGTTASA